MRKSLIVYYSWSGRTREMAEKIAAQTGADLLEICPQEDYPRDYSAVVAQAKEEIRRKEHPPIVPTGAAVAAYEVIFVGTPIWWGTMAPPVATFLQQADLHGKTVMPFSTHGGGGKGRADRDIARACRGATVLDMYTAYEGGGKQAAADIAAWLQQLEKEQ